MALSSSRGSAGLHKKSPSTELIPKNLRCVFCEIAIRKFHKENPKASEKVSLTFEKKHGLKKTKCFPLCTPRIKELLALKKIEVSWWCSNEHFVVKEEIGLYVRITTQPIFCAERNCFLKIRKAKSDYCHKHRNVKERKY